MNLYTLVIISVWWIDEINSANWNYEEQTTWADEYPECGRMRQSPINIVTKETQTVTGTPCLKWKKYKNSKYLSLQNTGHSIEATSTFKNGKIPIISGGILTGSYRLEALHFHWGNNNSVGSEHKINGRSSPLEMHLVHFNTKFGSITEAIASGESEALLVIGVLFRLSSLTNHSMYLLINSILKAKDNGIYNRVFPLDHLGLNFDSEYYTYLGSLTTPPCSEIVRWIIPTTKINVTPKQLQIFRNTHAHGKVLDRNFRWIQPLNNRQVQYQKRSPDWWNYCE